LSALEHLHRDRACEARHLGAHPGLQSRHIERMGVGNWLGTYKMVKVTHGCLKVSFHNAQQRIAVAHHQTPRFDPDDVLALHALELLVHALA